MVRKPRSTQWKLSEIKAKHKQALHSVEVQSACIKQLEEAGVESIELPVSCLNQLLRWTRALAEAAMTDES